MKIFANGVDKAYRLTYISCVGITAPNETPPETGRLDTKMTTATKTKKTNGFKLGSGCFTCQCCGKLTRKTARSETSLLVCDRCYEVGSCENGLSDSGYSSSPLVAQFGELEEVFKTATTQDEVYDLFNKIHSLLTA